MFIKERGKKTALVRHCVPAGCYAGAVVKGDCCCLFNNRNQTSTIDLDKLQLLALRFIVFRGKKRVFPRLIFVPDTAFFLKKCIFGEKTSFTHPLGCT